MKKFLLYLWLVMSAFLLSTAGIWFYHILIVDRDTAHLGIILIMAGICSLIVAAIVEHINQ
jgi:hypothetical protein